MTKRDGTVWFKRAARLWRVWAGVGGLVVMILYVGGACTEKIPAGKAVFEPGFPVPEGAILIVASNETVAVRIDIVGTAASEETIHLSARIPAYVREVFVSAGDAVKAGQVLIALDDREVREQLASAEARLKQAEAEFQRAKRLLETRAATEQAFDAAETGFRSAQADVERIHVMLSYAEIKSPIDGVVTDRRIQVGDLANPGQVLLSVYDAANMRIEAAVPVRLIERVAMGQEVDVILERPAETFRGRVTEIVSEVDSLSRTQMVKIHLEGASGKVLPGTFGRVWVEEGQHEAVLLPLDAVYRSGQLELIQVVRDGRVLKRAVKTGRRYGARVEILSGLRAGDTVLASPAKEE